MTYDDAIETLQFVSGSYIAIANIAYGKNLIGFLVEASEGSLFRPAQLLLFACKTRSCGEFFQFRLVNV